MAAELVPQRGQHPVSERVAHAGTESCEEGRGDDVGGHIKVDGLLYRPASSPESET